MRSTVSSAVFALALAVSGCGGGEDSGGGGASGGGSGGTSGGGTSSGGTSSGGTSSGGTSSGGTSSGGTGGTCDPDLLRTGLTAQQTGVSVDAFDCEVQHWTAQHGEPDAMLFKAIIYVESRFDQTAVACPNLPCGTPSGWTAEESGCFGLMQVVPACSATASDPGMLPNGHPNLTTDTTSSDWPGSIFHPNNNIQIGIGGVADNRNQVEQEFSGCTEDQYTLMAIGNYNSYGSTKSCTEINQAYVDVVLEAYVEYSTAAGYAAHPY